MGKAIKNWGEFKGWIDENGIVRWKITSTKDANSNDNKFIYDKEKSFEDNLATCKHALERNAGSYLYVYGWHTSNASTGGLSEDILFEGAQEASAPVQVSGMPIDRAELIKEIRQQVANEYERTNLERERKAFEEERKEFNKSKEGVMGALVGYLAPVAGQLLKNLSSRGGAPVLAGLDANEPTVKAAKIEATTADAPADGADEDSPFTDEEADKMFELMRRFKEVEPQYMELLEKVVEMAESGDSMYSMAKGVILK